MTEPLLQLGQIPTEVNPQKTLLRIPFDRETGVILQALRRNGNGLLSRTDGFHDLGGE